MSSEAGLFLTQGQILNNLGRGPLNEVTNQRSKAWAFQFLRRFSKFLPVRVKFVCVEVNQYCAYCENDRGKYYMINLHKRMLQTWQGLNPQPPDHQLDAHPIEAPRSAESM